MMFFYENIYAEVVNDSGVSTHPVEKVIQLNSDSFVVYYQYFEPWDWLVLIYMDEDIIYHSISTSINQMLLVVIMLAIIIGFFLYFITAKLTAPVDTLMDGGVKSIADGDYSKKSICRHQ